MNTPSPSPAPGRGDEAAAAFASYRRTRRSEDFARVYALTHRALVDHARRLRSRRDPEDLVQETYVAAIEASASFDSSRPLLPWLETILRSRCIDAWRSESRRPRLRPVHLDEAALHAVDARDPAAEAEAREAVTRIEVLLDRVPHGRLLRLRMQGMGPAEIAEESDLRSGAIRMRLHRALRSLRAKLPRDLWSLALLGALVGWFAGRGRSGARHRTLAWTATPGGVGVVLCYLLGASSAAAPPPPDLSGRPAPVLAASDDGTPERRLAARREALVGGSPRGAPDAVSASAAALRLRFALDGAPLASSSVRLRRLGGAASHLARKTDSEGRLPLQDVPDGEYAVFVGVRRVPGLVSIGAGGVVGPTGAELTVEGRAPFGVLVVDRDGRPVEGAELIVPRSELPLARTDAEGRAEVRHAFAHDRLHARLPDGRTTEVVIVRETPADSPVRLAVSTPGQAMRVELVDGQGARVPGARLRVHFNGPTPRPGGWVRWTGPPRTLWAEDGEVDLRLPEGAAKASMQVRAEGYRLAEFPIKNLRQQVVRLTLLRSFEVAGRVLDAAGAPVAGATVFGCTDVRRTFTAVSEDDGRFVFRSEPHDPMRVFVDGGADGYWAGEVDAGCRDNGFEARLVPGEPVRGIVRDESGRPVPQAEVEFEARMGGAARWVLCESSADGRFAFQPWSRDGVRLTVSWNGASLPAVAREDVRPGGGLLEIVLPRTSRPTAALAVRTPASESGGPVWTVDVARVDLGVERRLRDQVPATSDGRWRMERLSPGRYRVRLGRSHGGNGWIWSDPRDVVLVAHGTLDLGAAFGR